jgi:hypothetical protein
MYQRAGWVWQQLNAWTGDNLDFTLWFVEHDMNLVLAAQCCGCALLCCCHCARIEKQKHMTHKHKT